MASQNLSPRQKMINMMYLVLLAILALNVSAEALDAFLTFRDRLSVSALDANQTNLDYISQLKKAIDKEIKVERKMVNLGLKDTLDQIRSRTRNLVALIGAHARKMEEIADFDPETGAFIRFDELEENYQYWMGKDEDANERRGNGAARSLRDSLDQYFSYLNQIYNRIAPDSMAKESHHIADPPPTTEDSNKRWEQYTFQGPVIANLGVLESIKLEVFQEEKRLLDLLETRLGGYIFAPDKVFAFTSPTAKIVPAGMQFETQLFVGVGSSQMKPQFLSANGRIELTDGGNMATLKINADGSGIPSGKKEYIQHYTATIRVPKLDGTFEELRVSESFIVRKPEVLLTSTAIQNLYRRCGNAVNIEVPALGEHYDPVVSASHARVQGSERSKTRFLIDPEGRESYIQVKSRTNGQLLEIDRLKYNVIQPPKPEIEVKVNGRDYNGSHSLPKGSRVSVQLNPDVEFKRLMPDDARYGAARVVVKLKSGIGLAETIGSHPVSGLLSDRTFRVPLSEAFSRARSGDKIFIQIEDIYRRNYRGENIIDRRFGELERTVSFVIDR